MTRPTLKDVCREALVSEATVSRVVNNSPLVHERTRARVLEVIQRLGYTPNAAARNLSRSKTDVIGVVFHQMSSGFFAQVMDGIDRAAVDSNYHVLSSLTRDDVEPDKTCRRMFDEMRVDGMILLDPSFDDRFIAELKHYGRPMVMIQRDTDDPDIGSVSVENRHGARDGMKHLLSLGYRDILVLRGPEGAQDNRLRLEGCEQALKEVRGQPPVVHYADGFYAPHRAVEALREHRLVHGLPRAIFAMNDAMALAALKELRTSGIKVPEQVAIVGFDGIDAADYVGLTTVETPMLELGATAVRLLLAQIEDPKTAVEHVQLKTKLVVRDTCGGGKKQPVTSEQ